MRGKRTATALLTVMAATALLCLSQGHAAIPYTINYQGYLVTAAGDPVSGQVPMRFSLYANEPDLTPLWTETQTVTVDSGVYSVVLGAVNTDLKLLPFDVPYYLGVTVRTDQEMLPRQKLTSVGYAFRTRDADRADTLDGSHATDFASSGHAHDTTYVRKNEANSVTSSMIIDGTITSADVAFNYAASTAKGGAASDLACAGCVSAGELVLPLDLSASTAATTAVLKATNAGAGYGLYGYSLTNYGVYGYSSSVPGVFGYSLSSQGVSGVNGSWGNYGYLGSSDYGAYGHAYRATSYGVYGKHDTSGKYGALGGSAYAGYFNGQLYIQENMAGMSYALKLDNQIADINMGYGTGILFSTGGSGATRGKGALVYETTDTWNRGSFHFLQEQTADATNPVMTAGSNTALTIRNNGFVGIGQRFPQNLLDIRSLSDAFVSLDRSTDRLGGITFKENGVTQWIFPFFRGWQSDNLIVRDEAHLTDVMTFQYGTAKVGVGTSVPAERLEVAGNLKVSGSGTSVVFPDGTRQARAAPGGGAGFPRPAYDSGWHEMTAGQTLAYYHNLLLDIEDYVVRLDQRDAVFGVSNYKIGGDEDSWPTLPPGSPPVYFGRGIYWHSLTTQAVQVTRLPIDGDFTLEVRVRIWLQ